MTLAVLIAVLLTCGYVLGAGAGFVAWYWFYIRPTDQYVRTLQNRARVAAESVQALESQARAAREGLFGATRLYEQALEITQARFVCTINEHPVYGPMSFETMYRAARFGSDQTPGVRTLDPSDGPLEIPADAEITFTVMPPAPRRVPA